MTNFPWPDCGKEFKEWYESYCSVDPDYPNNTLFNALSEEDMKKIAAAAWDAGILSQLKQEKVLK